MLDFPSVPPRRFVHLPVRRQHHELLSLLRLPALSCLAISSSARVGPQRTARAGASQGAFRRSGPTRSPKRDQDVTDAVTQGSCRFPALRGTEMPLLFT